MRIHIIQYTAIHNTSQTGSVLYLFSNTISSPSTSTSPPTSTYTVSALLARLRYFSTPLAYGMCNPSSPLTTPSNP